jgi:iron complex outermembrane receptor protein
VNEGHTAVGVPKVQLNFAAEWDTPFVEGLTLSGRVIYTSSQYLNAANTQEIPSWTRFDIGARYSFEVHDTPITIRASVENVLDKSYWSSTSRETLYLGPPRTFLLSTTFQF